MCSWRGLHSGPNRRRPQPLSPRLYFLHSQIDRVVLGRRHIAGPDEWVVAYRAIPASCLCIAAAAVASLASSRDCVTRRSQWSPAWAMRVPR